MGCGRSEVVVAEPKHSTGKTAAGVGGAAIRCDCPSVDRARADIDGVSVFSEHRVVDSSGLESAGVRYATASGLYAVVRARSGGYVRIRTWMALAATVDSRISETNRRCTDS